MNTTFNSLQIINDKLAEAVEANMKACAKGDLNDIAFTEGKVIALTLVKFMIERELDEYHEPGL